MSQDQDQQREQLNPEVKEALKEQTPAAVWLEIDRQIYEAADNQFEVADRLRRELNYPVDLSNLKEITAEIDPIRALNDLHETNPKFPLTVNEISKLAPLSVLKAVLLTFTTNQNWT
jgi:hypothetical protein